ncbi:hypothetical protein J5N97_003791 [Dioscorea zingiberensis]|uniref:Uncharacterized protein n=1 Tax=Dioscorea zingiberensis TaxID=325984 RepID=A0A9D5D7C3_9LILI|nr:hypothetical protein J5N97_003791 [Dioscorea zingiberensis]
MVSPLESIRMSFNNKDELSPDSPFVSLRSIGIASGDLLFFSLDPTPIFGSSIPISSDENLYAPAPNLNPVRELLNSEKKLVEAPNQGSTAQDRQQGVHYTLTQKLRLPLCPVRDQQSTSSVLPRLTAAVDFNEALDLQDLLRPFGFDNICRVVFGIDVKALRVYPQHLQEPFFLAFDKARRVVLSSRAMALENQENTQPGKLAETLKGITSNRCICHEDHSFKTRTIRR